VIDQKLSCESLRASADNGSNEPGFCDPTVDRHIHRAQALELTHPERANRLWAKIDREIVDQAPWLPTLTFNNSDFLSKRVGNYQYNPQFGILVDQLWVR
jgi:peptide/nickel transport system substrate-binding protein